MMKLSFECEVPSLSQAERDALGKVIQKTISQWLFRHGELFTEEDIAWLKEIDRSFVCQKHPIG